MYNYKIYKNVRNASWLFLIDHQIKRLPVDLKAITKEMGIKVFVDTARKNTGKGYGATLYQNDTFLIALCPNLPRQVMRYTIAHEIGHIVLGHVTGASSLTSSEQEYQAERFAIDILAPACVLWGLGLHTSEEIASFCDISLASAKIRAERMKTLYARNAFLLSPLERRVFNQFRPYIDSTK